MSGGQGGRGSNLEQRGDQNVDSWAALRLRLVPGSRSGPERGVWTLGHATCNGIVDAALKTTSGSAAIVTCGITHLLNRILLYMKQYIVRK